MKTITARELRNDYAEVLRRVAAGETFLVSSRGHVVAEISGPTEAPTRGEPRREVPLMEVMGLNHAGGAAPVGPALADLLDHDLRDPYADRS